MGIWYRTGWSTEVGIVDSTADTLLVERFEAGLVGHTLAFVVVVVVVVAVALDASVG